MHIVRRKQKWGDKGAGTYLALRESRRIPGGKTVQRTCYLGPMLAEDLEDRARKVLRKRGYTPAEIREILLSVQVRIEKDEHRPILVRNRPVQWRDPPA